MARKETGGREGMGNGDLEVESAEWGVGGRKMKIIIKYQHG